MSGNQVFPGAQNFVTRGSTFMAAVIVCDALQCLISHAHFTQINYNTTNGNRATSDAAIPIRPNSSIQFTGQTDVLFKLKEHLTTERNDKLHC